MAFSTINKGSLYQNNVLSTGNGTSSAISVGFQPDLVWHRQRTDNSGGWLVDAVRGNNSALQTTYDNAEGTFASMTFSSTGFTVTGNENLNNENAHNYVSWNWKANGAGSSNTDGSITSTVSANTTAGFSIVKWTGDGSASATVGHGLGSGGIDMLITKDTSLGRGWYTTTRKLTSIHNIYLASNAPQQTTSGSTGGGVGNLTDSNTFGFIAGSGGAYPNQSGSTHIAYCFKSVEGYSKFSSYIGNGVSGDGAFCYTGFKPSFVIHKRIDSAGDWRSWNNKSSPFNQMDNSLFPNDIANEYDTDALGVDFLSNGIKWRQTDTTNNNPDGGTFIYMAFGQPIISNSGICATAR